MPYLLKRFFFRLHWILGLGAGLVLSTIGITGGVLGFEEELLGMLNPQQRISVPTTAPLSMDALIETGRKSYPDMTANTLIWNGTDTPLQLRLSKGQDRRGIVIALDQYTGKNLGLQRGLEFFQTVEQLHRNLTIGPIGKQIVGASTVILLLMLISGIVLRWPKYARSLSVWLRLDFKLQGRSFLWHLHAIVGTWALIFYLVAGLTGVWMSYDFVRAAINDLAGVSAPARPPRGTRNSAENRDVGSAPISIDHAWETFHSAVPNAQRAMLALPRQKDSALEWRYLDADAPHIRAFSTLKLDVDGNVQFNEHYADLPRGRRFTSAQFPLHSGDFFGLTGRMLMALASTVMPLFFITGVWLWLQRRGQEKQARLAQKNAS